MCRCFFWRTLSCRGLGFFEPESDEKLEGAEKMNNLSTMSSLSKEEILQLIEEATALKKGSKSLA